MNMQRFRHTGFPTTGRLLSLSGALVLLAVVAGCGSSNKAPADPWDVVATQHSGSANFGLVKGDVGQPSQVEVTVVTKPNVNATTHFTIACAASDFDEAKNKFGPKGMTPLTFRITVPTPTSGPSSCLIQTGADYPKNVDSTITLLQRDVPTTTSTTG
jgi:hypothetical protein